MFWCWSWGYIIPRVGPSVPGERPAAAAAAGSGKGGEEEGDRGDAENQVVLMVWANAPNRHGGQGDGQPEPTKMPWKACGWVGVNAHGHGSVRGTGRPRCQGKARSRGREGKGVCV